MIFTQIIQKVVNVLFWGLLVANLASAAPNEPANFDHRLQKLERLLDSQTLMQMLSRIEQLQQQVQVLQGEVEQQTHTVGELKRRQRDLYMDLDKRINQVIKPQSTPPPGTPNEQVPPITQHLSGGDQNGLVIQSQSSDQNISNCVNGQCVTANTPESSQDMILERQQAYDRALSLLKKKQYKKAIGAFESFLVKYPNGDFSDNAQYWLGEGSYVLQDYGVAIERFKLILTKYPQSSKVPDAMLKIGFVYYELKDYKNAKMMLTQTSEKFAGTSVARMAHARLLKIRKENH